MLDEEKHRAADPTNPDGAGRDDNIHTAHVAPGSNQVFVPGCRATKNDCAHMHWRWSGFDSIDVMVEPSNDETIKPDTERGKTYLIKGQTLDLGLVKSHPEYPHGR